MLKRFFGGDRSDPIRGRFQVRGGRSYEPKGEDAQAVHDTLAGRAAAIRQGKEARLTGVRIEADEAERQHRRGCGRLSRSEKSYQRGFGPTCWRKHRGKRPRPRTGRPS